MGIISNLKKDLAIAKRNKAAQINGKNLKGILKKFKEERDRIEKETGKRPQIDDTTQMFMQKILNVWLSEGKEKWDGPMDYWMAITGTKEPGINGGLSKRMPGQMGMVNTIDVPSIDEFTKKIIKNGGQLIVPKMPIPKIGWFAQCMDTELNIFGIIEKDEKAE